jgi:Tfp pilus assembly protein PilN
MNDKQKGVVEAAKKLVKAHRGRAPTEKLLEQLAVQVDALEKLENLACGPNCDCWSCGSYR